MTAIALAAIVLGSLADRLGRKPTFVLGLVIFAVNSYRFIRGDSLAYFLCLWVVSGAGAVPGPRSMAAIIEVLGAPKYAFLVAAGSAALLYNRLANPTPQVPAQLDALDYRVATDPISGLRVV